MSGKISEYNNKNTTNLKRSSIVKVRKEQDLTPIEILHAGTGLKIIFEQERRTFIRLCLSHVHLSYLPSRWTINISLMTIFEQLPNMLTSQANFSLVTTHFWPGKLLKIVIPKVNQEVSKWYFHFFFFGMMEFNSLPHHIKSKTSS